MKERYAILKLEVREEWPRVKEKKIE